MVIRKTIKRMVIYYLLFFLGFPMVAELIPGSFPFAQMSSLYYLTLSLFLILYYSYRIAARGMLRRMMLSMAWMYFLLLLFRGIKYSVVMEVDAISRFTWYLYYVPILLLPTFFFYVVLLVFESNQRMVWKRWWFISTIAVFLIVLTLTNDWHQLCFRFREGFINWDSDYTYGLGQYVSWVWEYGLPIIALIMLSIKCQVSSARKQVWLVWIFALLSASMIIMEITGILPRWRGNPILQFPETFCLLFASSIECCIQLGLIPSNEKHGELLQLSGIAMKIVDRDGSIAYQTEAAHRLSAEQIVLPDSSRIDAHTVLRKTDVAGGYGIWLESMMELDQLNEELTAVGKHLSEEALLNRLKNELKLKQAKIEQRSALYDEIARHTIRQSKEISALAERLKETGDERIRDNGRKKIILIGTYIKRYANLMLLAQDHQVIEAGEFSVSMAEMLRALTLYGIPGELIGRVSGGIRSADLLAVFEGLEDLMEDNLDHLMGMFVNISNEGAEICCKLIMETREVQVRKTVFERGIFRERIRIQVEQEDNTTYISMHIPGEVIV